MCSNAEKKGLAGSASRHKSRFRSSRKMSSSNSGRLPSYTQNGCAEWDAHVRTRQKCTKMIHIYIYIDILIYIYIYIDILICVYIYIDILILILMSFLLETLVEH